MAEPGQSQSDAFDESQSDIALTLTGRLPCIGCGYDLQGLSVLGACPECGAAIRATILHIVDPMADELRPLIHPRLVAVALPMWATAGLLAAMGAWLPRIQGMVAHQTNGRTRLELDWAPWVVLVFAAMSGLGALGLSHLLREVHKGWTVMAMIGAALYLPLLYMLWRLYFVLAPSGPDPYFAASLQTDRIILRLIISALLAGVLVFLRPNARLLVARSLALRSGRVDRQTIYAMVAAVGLTMVGDVVRLVAVAGPTGYQSTIDTVGAMVVLIGSMLFTLGLASSAIDTWRIRWSILTPSPSLRQVLGRAH
jgi:hypothetical protein